MNISVFSIRRPLPAIVFSIIALLLGWISFNKLPITRYPSVDVPIVSVIVTQFGASPAELEAQVTKTVEDAVAAIVGVNHIDFVPAFFLVMDDFAGRAGRCRNGTGHEVIGTWIDFESGAAFRLACSTRLPPEWQGVRRASERRCRREPAA